MSPAAKTNSRIIVGTATGMITVVTFIFVLGMGFAQNNSDHNAIKGDVKHEIARSTIADAAHKEDIKEIKTDIGAMREDMAIQSKDIAVQTEILKRIEKGQ